MNTKVSLRHFILRFSDFPIIFEMTIKLKIAQQDGNCKTFLEDFSIVC